MQKVSIIKIIRKLQKITNMQKLSIFRIKKTEKNMQYYKKNYNYKR